MQSSDLQIPLIVADGDIPTTRLVARELGVVFPRVEVRVPETLFGTEFAGRPVIISRLCLPELSWIPDYLRERGLRYTYLLDDNFWELTADVDVHVAPYFNHPAVLATLERFIVGAETVLVWSERLRGYLAARFPAVRVVFVPSGVDLAQIETLRPAPSTGNDDIIRIGYPTSRRPGVAQLLTDVVREIGTRYADRVQFEFVGWMPDALQDTRNVTLTPQIQEYDQYLAHVLSRGWDVGLAPLIGAHFESFKTDVKYREYASFRIPGVYSRVSPYTEAVDDGRTGVLVDADPQAWVAALSTLIEAPALRGDIAAAAYADMRAHRDLRLTGTRFAALVAEPVRDAGIA